MRKIYLLRHAEAPSAFNVSDIERPLSAHGKNQAFQIGTVLQQHKIDHVLCSSALRTQETLDSLKKAGAQFDKVEILENLYNAPADVLLKEIGMTKGNVLIIAHNPGIHQLAFQLAQKGDTKLIDELAMGYSPASLSIFENNKIIDLISPE